MPSFAQVLLRPRKASRQSRTVSLLVPPLTLRVVTWQRTQGQRRHKKRHRSRLPRCLPRPQQDLRKARHRLLGLSRITARSAKPPRHPILADNRQAPLRHRLTAPTFAPLTHFVSNSLILRPIGRRGLTFKKKATTA